MAASTTDRLARDFVRFGWTGVWVQAILAIVPILMLAYAAFSKVAGIGLTLDFTDYLALFGLAVLLFTTIWSYRYVRLGNRMEEPGRRPRRSAITRTLWVGLWASCIGIVISLLLLIIEVVRLLVLFLKAPQGGVPVIQTQATDRTAWVSAIDVVSLLAELCTLTGELVVLGFTLWLLFRLMHSAGDYDRSLTESVQGSA